MYTHKQLYLVPINVAIFLKTKKIEILCNNKRPTKQTKTEENEMHICLLIVDFDISLLSCLPCFCLQCSTNFRIHLQLHPQWDLFSFFPSHLLSYAYI